jgi:hypothetical protein
MKSYRVHRATVEPLTGAAPPASFWEPAEVAQIDWYHAAGSDHRPEVSVRLLYDNSALWTRFFVTDKYVRCLHTGFQEPVYQDSCCEFFLEPATTTGYFNIEINAVGALLISHITDPRRTADSLAGQQLLGNAVNNALTRWTTLEGVIDPEIPGPITYEVVYSLPYALLGEGVAVPVAGDTWKGNFYKCSENSSHPHWGAWAPIGEKLDYHQPDKFGMLEFQ